MLGSIGMPELIVIFIIALVVFGPRRLPELGRALGRTVNEFKRASAGLQETWEREIAQEASRESAAAEQDDGHAGPRKSEFSEHLSRTAGGDLG
jgi:sec-independent protein translocase protein TatA